MEKAFGNAAYTIKDGQILVKDGDVVKVKPSQTIWTNVQGYEQQEQKILDEIMPFFNKYYTVKFENYKVHDHYLNKAIEVKVQAGK